MPSVDVSRLDAVTVDSYGTLLRLEDPVDALRAALADRGVDRDADAVRAALHAEASYYRPRSALGRDPESLAALRHECVKVFLEAVEADLDATAFVPAFLGAIAFRPIDGAEAALDRLRAAGLTLVCVANWDIGLHEHLRRLGVHERFAVVVTSAEAGAEKPDPAIFHHALGLVGVRPDRALHIGNEDADREGARAAGLAFEPEPLATLPERLGL
jgi:putative hydrolase of the HAD superfamily